jgi:hypothetical protein
MQERETWTRKIKFSNKSTIKQCKKLSNAKWEFTHPLINISNEYMPLPLTLICLQYIRGGWCVRHEELYLGSKCLHCLKPGELNEWIIAGPCKLHAKIAWYGDHVLVPDSYNICITPSHEEDILLFKEWQSHNEKRYICQDPTHINSLHVISEDLSDENDYWAPIKAGTIISAEKCRQGIFFVIR